MAKKAPRRTAQRILEVTLDLFNRFGEPNVSTTAISAELGISPGNLYYHYPAKDALINTLFDQYEEAPDADSQGCAGTQHRSILDQARSGACAARARCLRSKK